MQVALNVAQVILSVLLVVLVIVQAKSPGMSGQGSSIHHTRRGLEKTLHQTTVGVVVAFLLLALVNSLPIF